MPSSSDVRFLKRFRANISRDFLDVAEQLYEEFYDELFQEAREVAQEMFEKFLDDLSTEGTTGVFDSYRVEIEEDASSVEVKFKGGKALLPRLFIKVISPNDINLFDLMDAGRPEITKPGIYPLQNYKDPIALTNADSTILNTDWTNIGTQFVQVGGSGGYTIAPVSPRNFYNRLKDDINDELKKRDNPIQFLGFRERE